MKRATSSYRPATRTLQIVLCAIAFMIAGCDNDVTFSPTEPRWSDLTPIGGRTLQISGSLTTADGSCLAATVLFDGREVAGSRSRCPDPTGCASLDLEATTMSTDGRHTVAFKLLRQSSEEADYVASGSVLVTRAGLSLGGGATLPLGPRRATLRRGESISFEVDFQD